MWTLEKPRMTDALDDLDWIVAHAQKLDKKDIPEIHRLYKVYDFRNGCLPVSAAKILTVDKRKNILTQYDKTTGTDGDLRYIREELLEQAEQCPYCGIGEPVTLDHYLPKSKFPALSVYRLNLVPSCSRCNALKGDEEDDLPVHPFYGDFLYGHVFLQCSIQVIGQKVVAHFRVSDVELSPEQAGMVDSQIKVMNLDERWRKAVNSYLSELFASASGFRSDKTLKEFLKRVAQDKADSLGANHWKTVLVKALSLSPLVTLDVAGAHVKGPGRGHVGA